MKHDLPVNELLAGTRYNVKIINFEHRVVYIEREDSVGTWIPVSFDDVIFDIAFRQKYHFFAELIKEKVKDLPVASIDFLKRKLKTETVAINLNCNLTEEERKAGAIGRAMHNVTQDLDDGNLVVHALSDNMPEENEEDD